MKERVFLAHLNLLQEPDGWAPPEAAEELARLAESSGAFVAGSETFGIRRIHPRAYLGSGQAERLKASADSAGAETVIVGRDLSGTQQRNLEKILGRKTLDRTQLILDIFARRARSNEGKLQVELAQLSYLLPRLVGEGIALSRTGGGIGTRGPGEQKLETNRRIIRDRIVMLTQALERMESRRELYRERRTENGLQTIALVGYTNAGKSTLFNRLTRASVTARDQLFSTLDPTVREADLGEGRRVLLADTVGFLHLLPHHLIESFKSTLEEVIQADLLLHVLDASHPRAALLEQDVEAVLKELGAQNRPRIFVLNQWDKVSPEDANRLLHQWPEGYPVSALKGTGLKALEEAIGERFFADRAIREWYVPRSAMGFLSVLYEAGVVKERQEEEKGVRLKVWLDEKTQKRCLQLWQKRKSAHFPPGTPPT